MHLWGQGFSPVRPSRAAEGAMHGTDRGQECPPYEFVGLVGGAQAHGHSLRLSGSACRAAAKDTLTPQPVRRPERGTKGKG